jgi:hypothetical protein
LHVAKAHKHLAYGLDWEICLGVQHEDARNWGLERHTGLKGGGEDENISGIQEICGLG